MENEHKDGLADVLEELQWQNGLGRTHHRTRTVDDRVAAIFPCAAEDVDEWERRCLELHKYQENVLPAPKPEENTFKRPHRFERGD